MPTCKLNGVEPTAETSDAGPVAAEAERIARHVRERGPGWRTIECPVELEAAFEGLKDVDVVLLDCLTFWISNLLCGGLSEEEAHARVRRWEERVRETPYHLVVVTNEVGLGLVPETPLGRAFRDVAGRAHQLLAPRADEVYFGAMGQILRLKPGPVEVA